MKLVGKGLAGFISKDAEKGSNHRIGPACSSLSETMQNSFS
jgi:hypothetical protein